MSLRLYAELTKPRLLPLVLVTGLPPLFMAAGGAPEPVVAGAILLGIALAAASANVLNCYVERDRDRLMERTRERPLPAARLAPGSALRFGVVLAGLSTGMLWLAAGKVAALLGVASILFYVFVYTLWLKPRSAWNAVIGGAAGAAAPLIADAAVNGRVTSAGLALFAIVFFWQPPHVWAIALYRKREYERARVPMLPSVVGDQPARWGVLAGALLFVPVALAPAWFGLAGLLYAALALGLCAGFVWAALRLLRERSDAAARRTFRVSLLVLTGLFLALLADLAVAAS